MSFKKSLSGRNAEAMLGTEVDVFFDGDLKRYARLPSQLILRDSPVLKESLLAEKSVSLLSQLPDSTGFPGDPPVRQGSSEGTLSSFSQPPNSTDAPRSSTRHSRNRSPRTRLERRSRACLKRMKRAEVRCSEEEDVIEAMFEQVLLRKYIFLT